MSVAIDDQVGPGKGRVLTCQVITPEQVQVNTQADFVALPIVDGELGVLPGHMPVVGRLASGELRIRRGTETTHLFVDGGFVQIRGDAVTVLTPRAVPVDSLNLEVAEREYDLVASRPVSGLVDRAEKNRDMERVRGLRRVAAKAKPR